MPRAPPGLEGEERHRKGTKSKWSQEHREGAAVATAMEGTRPLRISYFSEPKSFEFEAPGAYWRAIANAEYSCSFGKGLMPVMGLIVCQG